MTWMRSRSVAVSTKLDQAPAGQLCAIHLDHRLPVRKGNPKQIKDWNDLIKPGVSVITPNPKVPAAHAGTTAAGATRCTTTTAIRPKHRTSSKHCLKRRSAGLRRARRNQHLRRARHRRRADRGKTKPCWRPTSWVKTSSRSSPRANPSSLSRPSPSSIRLLIRRAPKRWRKPT